MKKYALSLWMALSAITLSAQQSHVNVDWAPQKNTENITPFSCNVISPEVHDDHTVTFRLYAPNAKEVVVRGTMFTGGMEAKSATMTKDDKGVWSVKAGPFTPDVYTYTFSVDGVSFVDPANTLHNHGTMPASSMLYVHGDAPAYYDPNPAIDHGSVTTSYYNSTVSNGLRTIVIYTPPHYNPKKRYPVLYLMGGSGEATDSWYKYGQVNWIMDNMIAERKIEPTIVVMVNNQIVHRSSPNHSALSFKMMEQEYKECIIPWVDSHYSTIRSSKGRALAGLSMGGHGGLWLGIRHQDVYGAAGSTSGGVDIRPFPKNWGMSLRLGTIEQNPKNWDNYTVINQVDKLKPNAMKLIIDCGTEDFFYEVNCALHEKLAAAKIPHEFYTRPGVHNWDYWRNSIQYQILFFSNYFKSAQVAK